MLNYNTITEAVLHVIAQEAVTIGLANTKKSSPYHTEAGRRQNIQSEFFVKRLSLKLLSPRGFYMLMLTVVVKTLSLRLAITAMTVQIFNKARTEYHGGRTIDG